MKSARVKNAIMSVICAMITCSQAYAGNMGAGKIGGSEFLSKEGGIPSCVEIAAPARNLATQSKYDQFDSSRSQVSEDAMELRNTVMVPIRHSIADMAKLRFDPGSSSQAALARARCVTENVVRWAKAGSLTQMASADAFLTRDRLISEILLTLISAERVQKMSEEDRGIVSEWLTGIADSTMEYYQYRAGQKSKMNNHRYWAALSVGSVGFFLEQPKYVEWGNRGYELGVCQVDAAGYLPLELSRGQLALDYHVYSLRPLQALAELAASKGQNLENKCNGGLKRLRDQTFASVRNSKAISELTGLKQDIHFKEMSFIAPLQLTSLGFL